MRELNENLFKGCIKRKISFTASTFIKFLITGTVAISLTACGGGGGGGGSSSSGGNGSSGDNNSGNDYVIVYPEIEQIKAEIDIENENKIFDENIVKKKVEFNYAGLKVSKNSEVAIQKEKIIDISGEKGITGVVVSDSSKITNEGNIKVSSDYLSKDILRDASSENIIKYMSKGMLITNKSTGINEGTIEIKGSTVGILAYGKGSTGINNGTIKLVGDKSKNNLEKIPTMGMASMKDGKVVNNGIIEIKNENSNLLNIGMYGEHNAEIINEKTGVIDITGKAIGMMIDGKNGAKNIATNNGNIKISTDYLPELSEEDDTYDTVNKYMPNISSGIFVMDKATGENNGTIEIEGSAAGVIATGKKSLGVNRGDIKITSKEGSTFDELPSIGMISSNNGKVVNEGNIIGAVSGAMGMLTSEGELLNKGTIQFTEGNDNYGLAVKNGVAENSETGRIIISSSEKKHSASEGITVEREGKAINKGKIEITNNSVSQDQYYDMAMHGWEGSELVNAETGIINISGITEGMVVNGIKGGENKAINNGTINIDTTKLYGTEGKATSGMVAKNGGEIENNKLITGKGQNIIGMNGFNNNSETINTIINNGDIELSGTEIKGIYGAGDITNNGTIYLNVDKEGKKYGTSGIIVSNGVVENSETGKIIISHGDKSSLETAQTQGIKVETGKAVNKGIIEIVNKYISESHNADAGMWGGRELINESTGIISVSGSSIGMVTFDGALAVNNGIIKLDSSKVADYDVVGTSGMTVENGGKLENNNLITGNGFKVMGMDSNGSEENLNTIINNGKIELSGTEIKGIYGSGKVDITNNGIIHLNIAKEATNLYGTKTPYGTAGIWIENGEAVNEVNGKIVIDNKAGDYADGVFINENGGKFTNKGLIEINGGYGAGIDTGYVPYIDGVNRPELQKEAIAINDETGVIRVTGTSDFGTMYGMIADGPKATIINRGEINVNGKNSFGMGTCGGATAENYGTIGMNGKLYIDKTNITSDTFKGMSAEGEKGQITNNGTIELKHTIDLINPYDNKGLEPYIIKNAIGMEASNGATAVNNKDIIGQGEITGISAENGSIAKNAGNIKLTSIHYDGKVEWDQDIITKKYPSYTVGLYGTGNGTKVENTGVIDIIGDGAAIKAVDGAIGSNSGEINLSSQILEVEGNHETQYTFVKGLEARGTGTVENLKNGKINVNGHGVGIRVRDNGKGYNHGTINISSNNYARGIEVRENGHAENHGDIIFKSGEGVGVRVRNNGTAKNFGTIIMNGKLYVDKTNITSDTFKGMSAEGEKGQITNNGTIELKHTIDLINPYDDKGLEPNITKNAIGMEASNGAIAINNKNIIGQGEITGMSAENGSIAKNAGNIKLTSIHYDGKVEWDLGIITKKFPSYTVGLYGTGNETKVENTGVIDIIGDGAAIKAVDGAIGSNNGEINLSSQILEVEENNETQYTFPKGLEARGTGTVENLKDGKININGHAVGIRVRDNGKGYNHGTINIFSNNYARGMEVRDNGYAENHGDIIFNSGEGMGIRVKNNGTAENFGRIYVKNNSYGIAALLDSSDIASNSASATNNGNITVIGTNSIGMQAFNNCTVTNGKDGIINVNGQGSYGMQATGVGAIANNYGIINVGDEASGGMLATEGGYIYNNGVINIDKAHSFGTQEDAENFAMQIDSYSKLKNEGTINTNADIKIEASGTYVIGTNRDGSYGRISARNMNLDGDVIVEADIVRGDYKKEHILENVVEAEDIKLGEDVKFESNSLLYNASAEKDVFGNLDAKLERNSNNISDFTDKKFVNVSLIFDDYINNEEEYNKLSSVEKDVVDTIFDYSTSENSLKSAVNQVTGTEYLNIQRQIFDIKNSFRKFDSSLISTLDNYDFNFQFIGEYSDISSKNGISGYESKMTGFNGAAKLSDNLYGVLGYGYSDIDYDGESDGEIQTIHTGVYKDSVIQGYNLRTGVYGEYNFHENNRAIFDKKAESDFNSYLVGVSGEVSKKYGKELYIQPSLSLDITYGNIESFDESKADGFNLKVDEENYTSILPKIKMDLGREFTNSKVFASIGYSYELGDMDKDMTIELLNKKADVKNNEMEHGQFDISVGGSLNINDLSLNAEVGKEFGRRDREYVRAGFSYRF